ncbi:hypothetical protein D3C72_2136440 [compost metagenome]
MGKQLPGTIAEPGFSLLHGDLPRGIREGEAVGIDVERGGIGGMHSEEEPGLILA